MESVAQKAEAVRAYAQNSGAQETAENNSGNKTESTRSDETTMISSTNGVNNSEESKIRPETIWPVDCYQSYLRYKRGEKIGKRGVWK